MQGVWSDAHTVLIGYIRDALGEELPEDLLARAEENVTLSSPLANPQPRRTDVTIVESEYWKQGDRPVWTPSHDPDLAKRVADPVLVEIEEIISRWVEIRSAKGTLITVIEVTSPANKTREGRRVFEDKLRMFFQAGVNVVEIDLIRGGETSRDHHRGNWPEERCAVIANRAHCLSVAEVYPCPLRESLPAVRVPLRTGEPDAALDLQPLIDRCYSRGRYWMLPYYEDPQPPLSAEDREWARERLRKAGIE
jgi:hypothetical protein